MLYMLIPYRGKKQFSNMHAIALRTHDRVFLCYCLMMLMLLHPRRRRVILLHSHYLKKPFYLSFMSFICKIFVCNAYIYSYAINNGRDTPRFLLLLLFSKWAAEERMLQKKKKPVTTHKVSDTMDRAQTAKRAFALFGKAPTRTTTTNAKPNGI